MKILLDHCAPAGLKRYFAGHEVETVAKRGWNELRNGELLRQAENDFDTLITTDKSIKYQQHLPSFNIAVIVLRATRNKIEMLAELMSECLELLETIQPGECHYLFTAEYLEREARRKNRGRK